MVYQYLFFAHHLLDKDSAKAKNYTIHLSLNCIDCLYRTFSVCFLGESVVQHDFSRRVDFL